MLSRQEPFLKQTIIWETRGVNSANLSKSLDLLIVFPAEDSFSLPNFYTYKVICPYVKWSFGIESTGKQWLQIGKGYTVSVPIHVRYMEGFGPLVVLWSLNFLLVLILILKFLFPLIALAAMFSSIAIFALVLLVAFVCACLFSGVAQFELLVS